MLRDFRHGYIAFFIFLLAPSGGAFYCAAVGQSDYTYISSYFSDYFANSINYDAVLKKALINNTVLGIILFSCAFFKFGILFILSAIFKEGFVKGFCCACLCRCMGLSGACLSAASELHMLILIPFMIISADKSMKMSRNISPNSKNSKIFFVFFQILVITIFCACAFMECYVNTTFMVFLHGKLIK